MSARVGAKLVGERGKWGERGERESCVRLGEAGRSKMRE